MARRRTKYLTDGDDRAARETENARIAAQCRLAELLAANPQEIAFVIGYLTHASLPGVIDGISGRVRDRLDAPT